MARMKFLCDAERCIECNGCVTAFKQENDIPWGVNRRRVVTINDGVPGERSICAWVVLRPDAAVTAPELTNHVAATLSPHKRPRSVWMVDSLPRNAMGKVLKTELRNRV